MLAEYSIKIEKKSKNRDSKTYDFVLDCTIVGDTDCGKTSLMKKIAYGRMPDSSGTVGICNYSLDVPIKVPYGPLVDEPTILFKVTEISGNDKYNIIRQRSMAMSPLVIFMYDSQRKDSLEKVFDLYEDLAREDSWKHIMFVLMACKMDEGILPSVSLSEVRKLSNDKGWLFFKSSAKDDSPGELKEKFSRIGTAAVLQWWNRDEEELWDIFTESPHVAYKIIS